MDGPAIWLISVCLFVARPSSLVSRLSGGIGVGVVVVLVEDVLPVTMVPSWPVEGPAIWLEPEWVAAVVWRVVLRIRAKCY